MSSSYRLAAPVEVAHHERTTSETRPPLAQRIGAGLLALEIASAIFTPGLFSRAVIGGIPISLALLAVIAVLLVRPILAAITASRRMKVVALLLVVWMGHTIVRLALDIPNYGNLALRDAVISASLISVLVGMGAAESLTAEHIRKSASYLIIPLAIFELLSMVEDQLPVAVFEVISFENAGPISLALFCYALWGDRLTLRFLAAATALPSLLVAQGRASLVAALVLLLIYVLFAPRRPAAPQRAARIGIAGRLGFLLVLTCLLAASFSVLQATGITSGRVGDVSVDTTRSLIASVFNDDSTYAGSREDREVWWANAISVTLESPSSVVGGIGLGPDLADGFRTGPDQPLVRKPHNDFIETFARFGLLGAVPLIVIIVSAIGPIVRSVAFFPEMSVVAGFALAGLVLGATQTYMSYPHGAILVGVSLGVAMRLDLEFGGAPRGPQRNGLSGRREARVQLTSVATARAVCTQSSQTEPGQGVRRNVQSVEWHGD